MGVYSGPNSEEDGLVLAIDAGNKKSFSPNVFPRGTDIYGWYVDTKGDALAANSTLSRDTISSPVGNTPLKMTVTNNDPYIASYNSSIWNLANAASGETWTISVYVKASQSTTGELLLFGANSSGAYVEVPNTTVNITTSWTRVSYTATFSNATTAFLQMRLDGPQSGGAGIDVWWDGLQIERGSTATEFTKEYTLDSSFNERTLDLSGNSNHGALFGSVSYSPSNGGVLVLPGTTGSYIDITSLNLSTQNYTVVGASRYVSIGGRVFSGKSNNWLMGHWSSSTVKHYANGWVTDSGSSEQSDTNWRIYAATGNYSTDSWAFYVNGQLDTGPNSNGVNGPNGFSIGRYAISNGEYSNSQISFLLCYNRVLTSSEIQRNFIALRGRFGI